MTRGRATRDEAKAGSESALRDGAGDSIQDNKRDRRQLLPTMSDKAVHILICRDCRHWDSACRPGLAMVTRLRTAINAAGGAPAQLVHVGSTTCMAGCDRPCTVAFQAEGKATYLFGDIDPKADIDALVTFALQYQRSGNGLFRAVERPGKLARTALARIPALATLGAAP